MKVRPASSFMLLDESMEHVVEIPDRPALVEFLKQHYYFWNPDESNVSIEHYHHDPRTGWDTHLICVDGKAALFSDGNLSTAPSAIPPQS